MTPQLPVRRGFARPRLAAIAFAITALIASAPAAFGSHAEETLDCGSAGTFVMRATETGAGDHQAPEPSSVLLLEGGGALTVLEFWVNGQLRFANASTGRGNNAVTEVTCSFRNEAGMLFEVNGILTPR